MNVSGLQGHVTTTRPQDTQPTYEDELDLRLYIDTLIKWWREVILFAAIIAIVAATAVFARRSLTPPIYKADATIVISRVTSDVNLNNDFQTKLNDTGAQNATSQTAHRASLVGLVDNGTVAQAVVDELGDLLDPNEKNLAVLLSKVSATSSANPGDSGDMQSDLIRISVADKSPEKATLIANSWARHYVEQVNALYGEMPNEIFASIDSEIANAEEDYNAALEAYKGFTATSTIGALNRSLAEKQSLIGSLQSGKQAALDAVISQAMSIRQGIITAFLEAQTQNRLLMFQKEQKNNQEFITQLLDSESQSRQMALQMDHDARVQIFQQYVQALIDSRLAAMEKDRDARSQLFDQVTDTEINNRLVALQTDQDARMRLFQQVTEAEISNRLLALQTDLDARLKLFNQATEAEINNRLLAMHTDQDARTQLFTQFVQTEISNRLMALTEEQEAKTQMFQAYTDADSKSKLVVFNQQVNDRIDALTSSYARRFKMTQLLSDARALQAQVAQGGEAATSSNSLAILLLKSEAYAGATTVANSFNLSLGSISDLDADLQSQQADLAALIETLETRIAELQTAIAEQSNILLANNDYQLPDEQAAASDQLHTAIQQKYSELFEVGDLVSASGTFSQTGSLSQAIIAKYDELFNVGSLMAHAGTTWQQSDLSQVILDQYNDLFGIGPLGTAEEGVWQDSDLSQAILDKYSELFGIGPLGTTEEGVWQDSDLSQAILKQYNELFDVGTLATVEDSVWEDNDLTQAIADKYNELFGVGALAQASIAISNTTPIYEAIAAQYPQMFTMGSLAELTDAISSDTELDEASQQKIKDLLELQGLEDLAGYSTAAEPMTNAIDQLDSEVRELQAQILEQSSRQDRLKQHLDLSLNAFNTLNAKKLELTLQRSVANREVRLGSAAIPPISPEPTTSLLMITMAAAMLGFISACLIAFIATYLGKEPFLRGARGARA